MPWLERGALRIELDEHGHLADAERWDETVADALAADGGIDALTDAHWNVIRYLRGFFAARGELPQLRKLCRETGVSFRTLHALFPPSPARAACRVAGLPPPEGCIQQPAGGARN